MSEPSIQADAVVLTVIDFLNGRKGFNAWWDNIRDDDKKELVQELTKEIQNTLNDPKYFD